MRTSRRRSVAVLLSLLVLSSTAFAARAPASSHTTYSVTVGAKLDDPKGESIHFFPDSIKVHSGDVIDFRSDLFHTVTVLTAGQHPDDWVEKYWKGQTGIWSPLMAEADEPTAMKVNPRVLQPSHPCGWPTQAPCPFTGVGSPAEDILNSGLPLFSEAGLLVPKTLEYSVEVNAPAGISLWALSLTNPSLRFRIDVVADSEPKSDPAAVASALETQLAIDRAEARTLHQQLSAPRRPITRNGRKIHKVVAGADTPRVSVFGFFPNRVTIRKGDSVSWIFDRLQTQTAMVMFPAERFLGMAMSWPNEQCDPDSDAGTAPDVEPSGVEFPYCEDFSQLELETSKELVRKQGDKSHDTYKEVNTSGVRGGINAPKKPYTLRFTRVSKKGFAYLSGSQNVFFGGGAMRVVVLPRR